MALAPIITLLTDFGLREAYVASMKGVILSICPKAGIVDISHNVPKFDVRFGAFALAQATPYFPGGTIHLAVVDPEVGTERHPIAIKTKRFIFVGPDNGVLSLSAKNDGVETIVKIESSRHMLPKPSKTFAGRDVFAPVAAHLANGEPLTKLGPKLKTFKMLAISRPTLSEHRILGEVLVIDSFGNLITNIRSEDIRGRIEHGQCINVTIKDSTLRLRFMNAYAEVEKGEAVALIGSSNYLEIGVNQGSIFERLKDVDPDTKVEIVL